MIEKLKKLKMMMITTMMTIMFTSQQVFASPVPPKNPEDVEAYVNLKEAVAFGGLVVTGLIVITAGLRWGWLNWISANEDDNAKIAELDDKKKKLIKYSALGMSGSIVTSILAFFA